MYVGRYEMVPIIATMMSRPASDATMKFLFLNSDSGMMGSCAWRSATTNSTKHTTQATPSAIASNEPQPTVVNSTRHTVPPMSSAVPRMSNLKDCALRFAFGRNAAANAMATMAMGTLNQKM